MLRISHFAAHVWTVDAVEPDKALARAHGEIVAPVYTTLQGAEAAARDTRVLAQVYRSYWGAAA